MNTCSRASGRRAIILALALILTAATPALAQRAAAQELTIQPTAADRAAGLAAALHYRHARGARRAAGSDLPASGGRAPQAAAHGGLIQYFGDVTYRGGHVLKSVISHAIYLQPVSGAQCTVAACWGDPEGFLRDLGRSDFIHDVDQYVGLYGGERYTVGFHATVKYALQATPLLDTDLQAFVHAVALQSGAAGYGHIFHVFLPPGQDECADSTYTNCYSPDNAAAFFYCGYHSSVDFADIGHVLYTFQPYQNVTGCQVQPGTINGFLVDSADDNLNHETIETITDPDGDAWTNNTSAPYLGLEIADECGFYSYDASDNTYYSQVPAFRLGNHTYAVQLVYSNAQHTCSSAP